MIIKLIFLLIVVALSALSIITYDIYPEETYNDTYDFIKILGPGIFYSFYLISFLKSNKGRIINYLIFIILWLFLFYLTYASWGWITSISGGIAGFIVGRVLFGLNEDYRLRKDSFLWTGIISATIGWALFFISNSNNQNAWGFNLMWIISSWQIGIGLLLIRKSR